MVGQITWQIDKPVFLILVLNVSQRKTSSPLRIASLLFPRSNVGTRIYKCAVKSTTRDNSSKLIVPFNKCCIPTCANDLKPIDCT